MLIRNPAAKTIIFFSRNMAASPFGRKPPSLSAIPAADSWPEPRRSPLASSKHRPKGDRNSISLDYAINHESAITRENAINPENLTLGTKQSTGAAAAAILEDPFDADWAALALRRRDQPTSVQRHAFKEENAYKSFELNM